MRGEGLVLKRLIAILREREREVYDVVVVMMR
jgi:hypothetical protein